MKNEKRPLGPNVKALMFKIAAKAAVPDGGGIIDGIKWIKDSERMSSDLRKSMELAFQFIDAVKNAHGPNPYGTDDETIAKAIVEEINERTLDQQPSNED